MHVSPAHDMDLRFDAVCWAGHEECSDHTGGPCTMLTDPDRCAVCPTGTLTVYAVVVDPAMALATCSVCAWPHRLQPSPHNDGRWHVQADAHLVLRLHACGYAGTLRMPVTWDPYRMADRIADAAEQLLFEADYVFGDTCDTYGPCDGRYEWVTTLGVAA